MTDRREFAAFLRRMRTLAQVIAAVLVLGTIGLMATEGVGVWRGFIWTLDIVATVGSIPAPATTAGQAVKVALIVLGVGTLFYGLVTVTEVFVSGHLAELLQERRAQKLIDATSDHYIICGFGRVGRQVARDLRAAGARYVVVDDNPEMREHAQGIGVRFIDGEPSHDEVLGAAGPQPADPRGARGGAGVPDGGDRGRARVRGGGPADRRHPRRCHHRRGARRERTVPAPAVLRDGPPGGRRRDGDGHRAHDGAPRAALRAGRDEGALVTPIAELRAAVEAAAGGLANGGGAPRSRPTLERPKQAGHGDYATNAALVLAPVVGEKPRDVAERLSDALRERLGESLARVEVAGPGFLNLWLADAWYAAAVDFVHAAGERFGALQPDRPEKVDLEFVSANPTGPLTAASGRHAAYGDALGRILELAGHAVDREYYFNDEGGQIRRLAESIQARARGTDPPEDGYQGEYVAELAAEIAGPAERALDELARRGVGLVVARIRATLE